MAESARHPSDRYQAYESAISVALDDLERAKQDAQEAKDYLQKTESRITELSTLIRHLIDALPEDRRERYLKKVSTDHSSDEERASGPVYNNVVNLFTRNSRKEWTASDVQSALTANGVRVDPKSVYNVLNYMARKGRLKRIGRGHYLVQDLGFSVHLDQDLEGSDSNEGGCSEM